MTDIDLSDHAINPRGVRVGQTWQKPDGRQFEVRRLEMHSVRARFQPSAFCVSERGSNRGLLTGFDNCTLVSEPREKTIDLDRRCEECEHMLLLHGAAHAGHCRMKRCEFLMFMGDLI